MKKVLLVLAVSIVGAVGCKKRGEVIGPDIIGIDSIVSTKNLCNCEFLNKIYITAKMPPEITVIGTPAKAAVNDKIVAGSKVHRFVYYSYRNNATGYQIYMKNNWFTQMINVVPKFK